MKVKPARAGDIIRDPRTKQQLPAEGGRVPDTSFWHRRLRDGDVVLVEDEPAAPPAAEPAKATTPTGLEPVTPLTTRKP
jgi:hypothetical protein